jgi:phage terminase small subunit
LISETIAARRQELASKTEIAREQVIAGLLAEAKNVGEGSSHSARVSAWAQPKKPMGAKVNLRQ